MSRVRNYCFTDFNTDKTEDELWTSLLNAGAKYAIYQKEQTETGTLHWQGYVQFKNPKSFACVRRALHPNTHWEAQKSSNETARDYCRKEETRVSGPYEFGTFSKGAGTRNDIEEFRDALRQGINDNELLENYSLEIAKFPRFISFVRGSCILPRADKPTVITLWGPAGSGKTRTAFERFGIDKTYVVSKPDAGRPLWWDGYLPGQHECVILDDFYGW